MYIKKESEVVPLDTKVFIAAASGDGSEPFPAFAECHSIRSFVQHWKEGAGAANLVSSFLHKAVGKMAAACMGEVSQVLDVLKPAAPKVVVVQDQANSPKKLLEMLVPEGCIATLVSRLRVESLQLQLNDTKDLLKQIHVPSELALAPLEVVEPHCPEQCCSSAAVRGDRPVGFGEVLLPCLKAYSNVVSLLAVAGLLSMFGDGVYPAVTTTTSKTGTNTLITPLLATCMKWFLAGSGLGWVQMKTTLGDMSEASLRYQLKDLDYVAVWLGSTWWPAAKKACLLKALEHLAKVAGGLKERVPPHNHVVTNTKYNKTLAKKQLLSVNTQALADGIDQVAELIADITFKFELDDKAVAECTTVAEADGVADAARMAMSIISAVSIVEEFGSSAEGAQQAEEMMIDKACWSSLPDVLKSKLKAVIAARK